MVIIQRYTIERYHFSSNGEVKNGFSFVVLNRTEWDELPRLLSKENIDLNRLAEFESTKPGGEQKSKLILVQPKVAHLGRGVHYVRYRDIDEQGLEKALIFCLTSDSFILVEPGEISLKQIERWAKRGILSVPMDLANILALEVFLHYQDTIDEMENRLFKMEKDILKGPRISHQAQIMTWHRHVASFKKVLDHHRIVLARLKDIKCGQEQQEELNQTIERLEGSIQNVHDIVENLRDAYQTAVQNRTNDIMKVLTIPATVLLPINLLTSFFGMNFINMPLTKTHYGIKLFYAASVMIVITVLLYFKRKDWL